MKFIHLLAAVAVFLSAAAADAAEFAAPRRVTPSADSTEYWPAFSQDGKELIFSRRQGGNPWQLFTVPVTGGAPRPLFESPPAAVATRVSRSAKGRLAFAGAGTIWVTDATDAKGANPRRVAIRGLEGNPSYPSWYPDGEHLLVVAYRGEEGGVLYRIDTASGEAVAVTDPKELRCGMPSVSPDGRAILFAGQKNEGRKYDQTRNSIWIIPAEGSARPLTPHQGRAATWSPDGKWVAYESTEGSPDGRRHAIFLIAPDGTSDHRITTYDGDANHPVWSPDGRLLAVSVLDPENPGLTRIATVEVPDAPE